MKPSHPQPSISVVIPAYNAERFLAEAIHSVLNEEYRDLEILVIDDGSTDRTLEVARSFPAVRCFSQANAGPAAARNLGLRESRGELLAFQDADDYWIPGRLETLLAALRDNPGLDAVSGRMQWVGSRIFKPDGSPDLLEAPFFAATFQSSLIRRSAFDRVGLLNSNLRFGEDLDWFIRAREAGLHIRIMDDAVVYYRRHEDNLTLAFSANRVNLRLLKASLDRRRRENAGEVNPLTPLEMDEKIRLKS